MIKYFTIEDLLKHYLQKKFHILGYTGLAALAAGLMLLLGIKKKRKEEDGEE